jgi:membrane-bound lytic murein transglycosylase F
MTDYSPKKIKSTIIRRTLQVLLGVLGMFFLLSNHRAGRIFSHFKPSSFADTLVAADTVQVPVLPVQVISDYDTLLIQYADSLQWDWRLVAALVAQESNFNASVTSGDGARGLMQVRPSTAKLFGKYDLFQPADNVRAGVDCLRYLQDYWKNIPDSTERVRFVLASYNIGPAHVLDAQRLAKKYGKSSVKWDGHVAEYLKLMSQPNYYSDPVVKYGKCRGHMTYNYVRKVLTRFEGYRQEGNNLVATR